jgi:hypothetical protein
MKIVEKGYYTGPGKICTAYGLTFIDVVLLVSNMFRPNQHITCDVYDPTGKWINCLTFNINSVEKWATRRVKPKPKKESIDSSQ